MWKREERLVEQTLRDRVAARRNRFSRRRHTLRHRQGLSRRPLFGFTASRYSCAVVSSRLDMDNPLTSQLSGMSTP